MNDSHRNSDLSLAIWQLQGVIVPHHYILAFHQMSCPLYTTSQFTEVSENARDCVMGMMGVMGGRSEGVWRQYLHIH